MCECVECVGYAHEFMGANDQLNGPSGDDELLGGILAWLVDTGLLVYHNVCTRPDGTVGRAWVLHHPAAIDNGSCLGWHEMYGREAVRKAVTPNVEVQGPALAGPVHRPIGRE